MGNPPGRSPNQFGFHQPLPNLCPFARTARGIRFDRMTTTTLAPRASFTDQVQPPPSDVAYLTTVLVNVAFVGEPNPRAILNDWVLIDAGIPMNASRIAAFARER